MKLIRSKKARWKLHLLKDWWGTKVWKKTTEVTTPLGFKLVSGYHPAYKQMRKGKFEIEETKIITRFLDKTDVFIDVGANLGYYTCLASQHGKRIVAFEPQRQNLKCLMQNLMTNGYQDQVEVFPLALSDKPGLLTLYGASGPSASLIKGWANYSPIYKQLIPVSTLDNVLSNRFSDEQLFIKIDVEGAEHQVLKGSLTTLARTKKPVWLLEICLQEFHPEGLNPDYQNIFELFWNNGYVAYTATNPPVRIEQSDVSDWLKNKSSKYNTFNYIFAGKETILPAF